MKRFRPLLPPRESPQSYPEFFQKIQYPLLGSAKYDGIRGIVKESVMSRTFIPLPSLQVQDLFSEYKDIDAEIIEGNPTDFGVYNRTQSHVMSVDKPGDIHMYALDYTHPDVLHLPFYIRLEHLEIFVKDLPNVSLVEHTPIENEEELLAFEEEVLRKGFEGAMFKSPIKPYKNGPRCTFREGIIYRLKRFEDAEAVVIGFEEALTNLNTLEENAFGLAKRSTHKSGMVPAGRVGKIIAIFKGQKIDIAPGNFTHEELEEMLLNPARHKGRLLKFRYFLHGQKDKPRHPRAIGWRNKMDI